MRSLFRIDNIVADVLDDLLPPQDGPGGCKLIEGVIARPGIYLYDDGRGGVIRELVPRDTLWDAATVETLARTPVTVDHPVTMVTDTNVRELQHGDVDGEIVEGKGGFVKIKMAIRTAEAKDAIANGKRELSPGYRVWVDDTPGVDPEFGAYDSVQRKREYNHVALCDSARGGAVCTMRIDNADVVVPVGQVDGYTEKVKEKHVATRTFEDDDGFTTTETTVVKVETERETRFPGDPAPTTTEEPFAKLDATISKMRADGTVDVDVITMALEDMKAGLMEGLAKIVRTAVAEEIKSIKSDLEKEAMEAAKPPVDPNAPPADPNAPPTDPNAKPGEDMPPGDPNAKPGEENAPPADPNAKPGEGEQPKADPNAPPADPNAAQADPKAQPVDQGAGQPPPSGNTPEQESGSVGNVQEDPTKKKVDSRHPARDALDRLASATRIDYTQIVSEGDLARRILNSVDSKLCSLSDDAAIGAVLALDSLGAMTAPIVRADAAPKQKALPSDNYGPSPRE